MIGRRLAKYDDNGEPLMDSDVLDAEELAYDLALRRGRAPQGSTARRRATTNPDDLHEALERLVALQRGSSS